MQYINLESTVYFHAGVNDTAGSGAAGTSPAFTVRLCGDDPTAAPMFNGVADLLTDGGYPVGCYELAVPATTGNGFADGSTYAVFFTLAVDGQNPTGFVGSFTLAPPRGVPTGVPGAQDGAIILGDNDLSVPLTIGGLNLAPTGNGIPGLQITPFNQAGIIINGGSSGSNNAVVLQPSGGGVGLQITSSGVGINVNSTAANGVSITGAGSGKFGVSVTGPAAGMRLVGSAGPGLLASGTTFGASFLASAGDGLACVGGGTNGNGATFTHGGSGGDDFFLTNSDNPTAIAGLASQASVNTVNTTVNTINATTAATETSVTTVGTQTTAIKTKTDNLPAAPAATGDAMTLTGAYDYAKGTAAMTESYAANGVAPTPEQALFAIHQMLQDFLISGTSLTVHKLDGATKAFVVTLNDATTPTGASRA